MGKVIQLNCRLIDLSIESGLVGLLPTSLLYNRRIRKQTEQIRDAQAKFIAHQRELEENRRAAQNLSVELFWDNLTESQKHQAKDICLQQGRRDANDFIEKTGMRQYSSRSTQRYL